MSDELKRCPFCGGEARIIEDRYASGVFHVGCGDDRCLGFSGIGWTFASAGAARIAWNARAAVTDEQFATAVHDGRVWKVVRECDNLLDHSPCAFECSECGFSVRTVPDGPADWQTPFWSYCPRCGAKVAV